MKTALLTTILVFWSGMANADFSGNVALELFLFAEDPRSEQQFDNNATLSFQPKWSGYWNDGDDRWSAELFFRADDRDNERNHADIRELLWLHIDGDNEWRVGINTMFWGVVESQHLVDVINQIDQLEGIDGEDKLGQPMVHLKHYEDWGVLDFLVLPGFRERSFQSETGRPRTDPPVDVDAVTYESSEEDEHIDYAIRYSHTVDQVDFGLSWFKGTNRDPEFVAGLNASGEPVLVPNYEQMTQIGVDILLIDDVWTWKLEMIHRETASVDYEAFTGGVEYTFYGIFKSDVDFGTLIEYSHDNRAQGERGVFDRDLFFGGRLAFNDIQSTQILAGFVIDTDKQSRSFRVEADRRLGDTWKASVEVQIFDKIDEDDPLLVFEKDDYLLLEIARFF